MVYQWLFDGVPLTDTDTATLVIPNVQSGNLGTYQVVVTNHCAAVTSTVATLTSGEPPFAANDTWNTATNTTTTIPVSSLLANDFDPDGDPLSVISVSPISLAGGNVTLAGSNVLYTPQSNFEGSDIFTYTETDNRGGSATASVIVTVVATPPGGLVVSVQVPNGSGSVDLTLEGIPARTYTIQVSTNMTLPQAWQDVTNLTADAQGQLRFTDAHPPMPAAFYRSKIVP